MPYGVELSERAGRDLVLIFLAKKAAESRAAARWFNGVEAAVLSLEARPRRCPAAPEAKQSSRSLRQLLYGKRPHVYRIIFEIDEKARRVVVITIRHSAMAQLKRGEI